MFRTNGNSSLIKQKSQLAKGLGYNTTRKLYNIFDGNSLVPQLIDQSAAVSAPAIASWGRGNYSIRTENWRFIQYFDGTQELYNHQNDNNEWHNLAMLAEYKPKVEELSALLPKTEVPTVEEYVSNWGLYGADKEHLKKLVKGNLNDKKKAKNKVQNE